MDCSRDIVAVAVLAACSLAFAPGMRPAPVRRPVPRLRNLAAPPSQLLVTPAVVQLPRIAVAAVVRLPRIAVAVAVRLPRIVVAVAVRLPRIAVAVAVRSLRIAAVRSWFRAAVAAAVK